MRDLLTPPPHCPWGIYGTYGENCLQRKKIVSMCSTACHFPPESLSERWNPEKAHAPPQLSPTWRLPTQKNTTLSMLASVLPMQACESYGWWMKPHLFVKGKAITLKSTVSLSNTQSTSRTIATQSKRWEAPHAPVCPTDTQALWLEETMKHFNRQEKK